MHELLAADLFAKGSPALEEMQHRVMNVLLRRQLSFSSASQVVFILDIRQSKLVSRPASCEQL